MLTRGELIIENSADMTPVPDSEDSEDLIQENNEVTPKVLPKVYEGVLIRLAKKVFGRKK